MCKKIIILHMINITFLSYGDLLGDVRLLKISKFLYNKGYSLSLIAWNRTGTNPLEYNNFKYIKYLVNNGSERKITLLFNYIVFTFKLLFTIHNSCRCKNKNTNIYYAVNFFSAFCVYINSIFKKDIIYIYDIYDEVSISYRFPSIIKKIFKTIDIKIRKRALKVIHVESNRVAATDNNYIIIRNSPFDYFEGTFHESIKEISFAVTGYLQNRRGLESIYLFAKNNPAFKFIIAGKFKSKNMEESFSKLANTTLYNHMPQDELFKLILNCSGIFSLYDPLIEINKLAASNKLYDAMMLGIPVIVNREIEAAKFVEDNNIGYVVDYKYNKTWDNLTKIDPETTRILGKNGRKLYTQEYEFSSQLEKYLIPILNVYK